MMPSAKTVHPSSAVLRAVAAGVTLATAACSDIADPTPHAAEIVAIGRLERGLPLLLRVVEAPGDTVPSAAVAWSVEPADAGTLRGDTLRVERAGSIRVTAVYGGRELTRGLDVAAPPAILFDMVVDGNRDLYRAALDGGEIERLTTHGGADFDPTIAGGVVVFVSDRDGNDELYALPLDGGGERRLTATGVPEKHPALSPDGSRLAFVRGSGLTRLYVANADASQAQRPDPEHGHDGTLEVAPAWSPDGGTLAFVSTAAGNPDLYLWSGGTATFLEGSDGFPAWLADGRIIYVAYDGSTPALRWLDPAEPGATHTIPLPGPARNPVALPPHEPGA